jgi:two-component system cell cycle response regulator DivK
MAGELVLIVEDDERNLKLVRDLLRYRGYRTLEAGDAEAGIALALAHVPDLILMDIQLPDMAGDVAVRRLKAERRTASVPVIALTAFAMKEDRARLLGAGFDDYIAKPIDIKELPEQVRRYCAPARPEG